MCVQEGDRAERQVLRALPGRCGAGAADSALPDSAAGRWRADALWQLP